MARAFYSARKRRPVRATQGRPHRDWSNRGLPRRAGHPGTRRG